MNLSEIRSALQEARVRPVKTLGQNFLHDQNLARWIVDQAKVGPDDFVLEIGPGLGALTEQILARGARLLALEKDARLVEFLRHRFPDPRFEIRREDALKFDTRTLFPERNVKVLGNLPYYIGSQILIHFVSWPSYISLALFMLQDEMARRVAAGPANRDYGALTLRIQLHHRVEYLRKIPKTVFFPQPDVASALVRITPRPENEIGVFDFSAFHEIVRAGFSHRRKQLRKALSERVQDWEDAAQKIGALPTVRAEELSREQWIALANSTRPGREESVVKRPEERFPLVDEHDKKIGAATRTEVHENNFRHRAVHILVFNAEGEVLLQKRSAWKDRHPFLWDSSAAGHVEADEAYDAAASRELHEELGIQTNLQRLGKIPASERTGQEFIWLYRGEHEGPFAFPPEEITAVEFFPVPILDKWVAQKPEDFAPGFLECWQMWREKNSTALLPNPAAADSTPAI
jgi:16S rRNA (adenine1518-N6/adenine1519-N6)-dimethyltransferase